MWIEIIFTVLAALGVFMFLGAMTAIGDNGYHPMSPDQEYEWLTGECGLTPEAARDIMDDSWKERL